MDPTRAQANRGMQRDLRVWWWAIMAIGFAAAVVFLALPASGPMRPLVFAWLIAFAAIGLYQRRRTLWPRQPPATAPIDAATAAYRAALELRRDQQRRWPARRVPVLIATVAVALLVGLAGWLVAGRSAVDAFRGPLVIIALALALFAFTRRMTNRAAADFQRELDRL